MSMALAEPLQQMPTPVKVRGRPFQKGYKGGPGNPNAHIVNKMRCEVLARLSPAQTIRVWNNLTRLAETGDDVHAIDTWLRWVFGKNNSIGGNDTPNELKIQIVQVLANPQLVPQFNDIARQILDSQQVERDQSTEEQQASATDRPEGSAMDAHQEGTRHQDSTDEQGGCISPSPKSVKNPDVDDIEIPPT